jgi:DNA-directed RNA polymerase subunit RPC12/RpoP
MIEFHCKNCGQKFSVPEIHAGKKGKCPKCKNIVVVPKAEDRLSTTSQSDSGDVKVSSENSPYDSALLDILQKGKASAQPSGQYDISDGAFKDVPETEKRPVTDGAEPAGERKLPWIIDIVLYPTNKAGLTMIGIIIGVPLLFGLIAALIFVLTLVCPLLLIVWTILQILGLIISPVFAMYLYWYLCECVRDSALGGIRAPETLGKTPGLGDMLWNTWKMIVCCVIFVGPSGIYFLYTHKTDAIFWALLAYGVFFFPMGLLAIVMFDSFSGLNPILLIGSVVSTFLPYVGLILLIAVLIISVKFLLPVLSLIGSGGNLGKFIGLFILYGSGIVDFYLMMVIAHLLGRFYWRYQEKLNWDV